MFTSTICFSGLVKQENKHTSKEVGSAESTLSIWYFRKILCHRSKNGKVPWDKMNYILKVIPMIETNLRLPYAQFNVLSSV